MDNGCEKCAELKLSELCLDCQIEQADVDVSRAMNLLERLKQKRQKLIEEKENTNGTIRKR